MRTPQHSVLQQKELAESYMEYKCRKDIMAEDPKRKITMKTAQECICDCTKECSVRECICPICTGFSTKLEAWESMRVQARKDCEICDCAEFYEGSSCFNASANPFP
jgi:hypothetical protein